MLTIPVVCLKDKQFFSLDMLSLLGKPIDVAKRLKENGYKLIHIVDPAAISGTLTNLDIFDKLTYFVNIEVECAPKEELVRKLLTYKCRAVLSAPFPGIENLKETKLLVAKISKKKQFPVDAFHDVILEDANEQSTREFSKAGKRIIIYEKDKEKVKTKPWGIICDAVGMDR